jgi:hypothetical protein
MKGAKDALPPIHDLRKAQGKASCVILEYIWSTGLGGTKIAGAIVTPWYKTEPIHGTSQLLLHAQHRHDSVLGVNLPSHNHSHCKSTCHPKVSAITNVARKATNLHAP